MAISRKNLSCHDPMFHASLLVSFTRLPCAKEGRVGVVTVVRFLDILGMSYWWTCLLFQGRAVFLFLRITRRKLVKTCKICRPTRLQAFSSAGSLRACTCRMLTGKRARHSYPTQTPQWKKERLSIQKPSNGVYSPK